MMYCLEAILFNRYSELEAKVGKVVRGEDGYLQPGRLICLYWDCYIVIHPTHVTRREYYLRDYKNRVSSFLLLVFTEVIRVNQRKMTRCVAGQSRDRTTSLQSSDSD